MRTGLLAVTLLGTLLVGTARADRVVPPARIESARGMALGSGARASAATSQAQAENPANLVLGGVYQLESFVGYDPTFKRFGLGASITDSMTARLAAGFSVRTLLGDGSSGENSGFDGRLGLAIPIGEILSIGVAGRYANFKLSDQRAVPERPVEEDDERPDQTFKLKGFTLDTALTLRLVPGLAISALAYNLVDKHSPLAPMMVGGSLAFSSSGLTLGGDVLVDLDKAKVFGSPKLFMGTGVEYLAGGISPLRIGYAYDQGRAGHYVTGGVGYVDARFGVQLGLRQRVSGASETNLLLSIQYYVH